MSKYKPLWKRLQDDGSPLRTEMRRGKESVFQELWKNKFLYLLAAPAIAYTFIYGYLTLPYMVIAFERFNFRTGLRSPFVGLENFKFFFSSSWAWTVTRNTVLLNFLFIIAGSMMAVFLAIVVNEGHGKRFTKVSQSLMLFPYFISWVIVSYILQSILENPGGLINRALVNMGGNPIPFYSTANYWYVILIVLTIWKNSGYSSIIYLAAITGIDEEIYEAAYIDGAGRWGRIRYITLPLLMPTVVLLTLMSVGRIFYGDFGMFYAIIRENGQLMSVTEVIDTYVFRTFRITGDPGVSMAIGFYQSVVGFILVCGSNWLARRLFPEGALF